MTRRLLPLLLMCLLPLVSRAQVGELRNDWVVGVNAGVCLNKVSFNPTINQKYHIGPTMGLTARYTCEKYFSLLCALQVELNYTQMGWRENIEVCTDTYRRNINYLQLPLLAHLSLGQEHNGFAGYLVLGPQVGFYVSDSDRRGGPWTDMTQRPNHVYEQYDLPVQNAFEYGITGGLGGEFTQPRMGHFKVEGRYYFGLSDIFNNGKKDRFGRSANGTIVAKVSYLFDVKKLKKKQKKG